MSGMRISVHRRAHRHFDYHHIMDVGEVDVAIAPVAAAMGEPARVRMLYRLADGRARTSTELAMMAGVTPPTASAHLQRLLALHLVTVVAQGKHRTTGWIGRRWRPRSKP